jgi:hypothetical protein
MIEEFFLSDELGDDKLVKAGIMEEWKDGRMGKTNTQYSNIPSFHCSYLLSLWQNSKGGLWPLPENRSSGW